MKTFNFENVAIILEQFKNVDVALLCFSIESKHKRTGHLEEKGALIEQVVGKISKKMPTLMIYRMLWNMVLLVCEKSEREKLENNFSFLILEVQIPSQLEIYSITGETKITSANVFFHFIDIITEELSSPLNFGKHGKIFKRFINGIFKF